MILLDARKSFDAVELNYLYYVLGKFGFGDKYNSTFYFQPIYMV